MDEQTRVYLDAAPTPALIPEKAAAFMLGKSPHTLRGWRNGNYPPHRFEPPPPVRSATGRYFYRPADLLAFVARTGSINPALINPSKECK